jgi:hypothetical protein
LQGLLDAPIRLLRAVPFVGSLLSDYLPITTPAATVKLTFDGSGTVAALTFPEGFRWGVSTAGFQSEMGGGAPLDVNSDWWQWTHDPLNKLLLGWKGAVPEDGPGAYTQYVTDANLARTDAANTFTGVQTMTSPALTTPAITGSITGTYSFGGTPTWPTFNQNTTGTAANVTGTVAVGNGGTGATTLTANNVLLGNGTSAVQVVAPGTTGNVLTSNGTTWTSAAAAGGSPTFTTTVSSATTVTLTTASNAIQEFTGSSAQTVVLPTTSIVAGRQFTIFNNSTGLLTINSSSGAQVHVLAAGSEAVLTALVATPTTAAHWEDVLSATFYAAGKSLTVSNSLTLAGTDATIMTFPGTSDTVVTLAASQALTNKTLTTPTLTNPTVNNYTEGVVAIGTVTTSSTISLTNGTVQTVTLTASTACTFTMPTATAGKSFTMLVKQAAATGNGTATWTGVKWPTAGAPTITATAGRLDILNFVADGSSWYGSYVQGFIY